MNLSLKWMVCLMGCLGVAGCATLEEYTGLDLGGTGGGGVIRNLNFVSTEQEVELGQQFSAEVEKEARILKSRPPELCLIDRRQSWRVSPRQDVPAIQVIDAGYGERLCMPGNLCMSTGLMKICSNGRNSPPSWPMKSPTLRPNTMGNDDAPDGHGDDRAGGVGRIRASPRWPATVHHGRCRAFQPDAGKRAGQHGHGYSVPRRVSAGRDGGVHEQTARRGQKQGGKVAADFRHPQRKNARHCCRSCSSTRRPNGRAGRMGKTGTLKRSCPVCRRDR